MKIGDVRVLRRDSWCDRLRGISTTLGLKVLMQYSCVIITSVCYVYLRHFLFNILYVYMCVRIITQPSQMIKRT
jgi:hypothetical protein